MTIQSRLNRPGHWPGRSNVLGRRGVVCASQPLAAQAGIAILQKGGNAIDAAIATAATLCVVEPMSTGIGGDLFSIYWSAKDNKLKGLNGSGRCPANLSWRTFARVGMKHIPLRSWLAVSVPGTVDAWWQMHSADGRLPWSELFDAAIHYAREGFPISEIIAGHFSKVDVILQNDSARQIFMPGGEQPVYGQVLYQKNLAKTFEVIAQGGPDAFYRGEIADEVLRVSAEENGFFGEDDFANHSSSWVEPLQTEFGGLQICELPPNGQGMAALIALNILNALDVKKLGSDWNALSHAMVEAVKLAYAERNVHVADPEQYEVPLRELLSLTFAAKAGMQIDPQRADPRNCSLVGDQQGDTVYLCAADDEGNLVSLINSLFHGFGSGVVAGKTGILLQNRAACFSLEEGHANRIAPGKRPFHTIIPGFATKQGKPHMAFGVMGGHHQAQGHVQFLVNLLLHEMGLQESLSAPRFDFRTENFVALERDFPPELQASLAGKGHQIVENDQGPFGGAQAIRCLDDGVMEGASDPRKDGCAIGW